MRKVFIALLSLSFLVMPILADDTTFSSPAGGEVWVRGTQHTITYTFSKEMTSYEVSLLRNGVYVGTIEMHNYTYPAGVYNIQWPVGSYDEGDSWAPVGSGYTLCVNGGGSPSPYGMSNPFTISFDFSLLEKIKRIPYSLLPRPGDCPQCIFLDLTALREALARLKEPVAAGLYWRRTLVASLGQVGGGPEMAVKLQVKLGPEALAALNRGEEFELRVVKKNNRVLRSQAVLLVAARLVVPRTAPIRKN